MTPTANCPYSHPRESDQARISINWRHEPPAAVRKGSSYNPDAVCCRHGRELRQVHHAGRRHHGKAGQSNTRPPSIVLYVIAEVVIPCSRISGSYIWYCRISGRTIDDIFATASVMFPSIKAKQGRRPVRYVSPGRLIALISSCAKP